MASTDPKAGEPSIIDKEYTDIIKSETNVDKKFIDENGIATKIIYYCRECKEIIIPKRIGKKFQFSCPKCKSANVAFGSEKSIANYYKIPEGKLHKPK